MSRSPRDNALLSQAQAFRRRSTSAEARLWDRLRAKRLAGLKFRRQHPIWPFIPDFCCLDHRGIIEVDGAIHDTTPERDAERTVYLEALGYRVLRFTNVQIVDDLDAVCDQIRTAIRS